MTHRLVRTTYIPLTSFSILSRQQTIAHFGTSSTQWFRRFLSPKEENQLYLGITALFREKLKEKSDSSNQSYSNIIDQVILGTQTTTTTISNIRPSQTTLKELGRLKQDIDAAGKAKDMEQLDFLWNELQQAGSQVPTTMYNRLIRSYLSCPSELGLEKAKQVVNMMETKQHRLPTTRTCTYLIQAHLKRKLPLEEVRPYVAMLQHYSLDKLKTPFDCSVMMRYYIECGNTHAIDFLWRYTMRHVDTIQPGPALYTQYVEWLLSSHAPHNVIASTAQSLIQRFGSSIPSPSTNNTTSTSGFTWTQHQISTWLNVVRLLTHSTSSPSHCLDAEKLLLCLVNVSDTTAAIFDNTDNNNNSNHKTTTSLESSSTTDLHRTKKQGIQAIQDIIRTYLEQAQDLKVLAFYYRLRESGVKEDVFGTDLTRAIGTVIGRVELQQEWNLEGSKTIADELGLAIRS
ncbi:uncharacterized protein BX664DRAFT_326170 [Halteromyces radiatus]|uniref:uncharacterized protein n=1 Tax=Halteromyces radiatus TaxID=101107 RepID=UPI002220D729|nr:uncharacterized protein BX664DRAFT_326170 [Halteromyces radiatus]KAI8097347.1 hypothetical protein BX664DRAFT_326170 [Halteromyces radiatus]